MWLPRPLIANYELTSTTQQRSSAALGAFANLKTRVAWTDFPPRDPPSRKFDYASVAPDRYWGDTIGVFEKTRSCKAWRMTLIREPLVAWANDIPPLR